MKKDYDFREMSGKMCHRCGRLLKRRLVTAREPQNITFCYKCWALVAKVGGNHDPKKF